MAKGFGKAQPKKEKGAFSHFWVVDSEVWAFDNKTGGKIKPYKDTNQYKTGDTASIDSAVKELDEKADGFYKFGVHKAGAKASWKFDELSTATKRDINATKELMASKVKEKAAMQIR